MCGIVGYIGTKSAQSYLLEGLRRLEYRGYDSAGVATITPEGELTSIKAAGRIKNLSDKLRMTPARGKIGIGHTRWATHGAATDNNSHPHIGGNDTCIIVHNGVIENYKSLKEKLLSKGYVFQSETDSEVVAHLIADCLEQQQMQNEESNTNTHPLANYTAAMETTLQQLKGTYGLLVMFKEVPDAMFSARLGSPLVVGVGKESYYIGSDVSPIIGHTDKIVYLADNELAILTKNSLEIVHREVGQVTPDIQTIDTKQNDLDMKGYDHFMLKEIFEQPESIKNTLRGRLVREEASARFGGLNIGSQQLANVERIVLTACGTSWHAALVGEYMIESIARIPVEVQYASELRYRNSPMDRNTLLFSITQSGETADTLAALREVKRKGFPVLAICNVVGSTIAREADGGIYLHAGPEIGVASTKAFTSQCATLAMLALQFGRMKHLSFQQGIEIIDSLENLPNQIETALKTSDRCREVAEKYYQCQNFLYLGRLFNFPVALEGALKLKEISYIHAEGYPAAELKHGPIALIEDITPSVFIVPKNFVYEKIMANIEEVKARGGPVIAIATEGDTLVETIADEVIYVPDTKEYLEPFVTSIPLQLLAYHIAVLRGCDVDKPRNLAKSVTVE